MPPLMRLLDKLFGKKRAELTPDLVSEIRRSFEESAADEEHFPSTIDPRIYHVKLIVDTFGDLSNKRALDLGCGKGRFARILKEHNPAAQIVAMDLAVAMLGYADRNLDRVAASMLDLPFASSSFDAAYATESLEHAVDIERAVGEMCRVVKPGGRIVVIDKNAAHWGRLKTPQWERWFGAGELKGLLARHCRQVDCRPVSYWEDVEPDGLFLAWTAVK
ncbi:MAG: class I SAM-dependent methyltransferase [Acidobacteria bacterium]|nr:class I SAM-dependent methyltransferase [Acidobacteriota bacterium]